MFAGATILYGGYALARPEHLARQTGIDPATSRRLGRLFGVRDVASGLSLYLARSPRALRRALIVRAAFDAVDVVGFGALAPVPSGRAKGAAAGGTWGAIALLLARANDRPETQRR